MPAGGPAAPGGWGGDPRGRAARGGGRARNGEPRGDASPKPAQGSLQGLGLGGLAGWDGDGVCLLSEHQLGLGVLHGWLVGSSWLFAIAWDHAANILLSTYCRCNGNGVGRALCPQCQGARQRGRGCWGVSGAAGGCGRQAHGVAASRQPGLSQPCRVHAPPPAWFDLPQLQLPRDLPYCLTRLFSGPGFEGSGAIRSKQKSCQSRYLQAPRCSWNSK